MEIAEIDILLNASGVKSGAAEVEGALTKMERHAVASAGKVKASGETAGAGMKSLGREAGATASALGSLGGPAGALVGRLSTVGTAVEELTRSLGAAKVGKQALEAAFSSGLVAAPTLGAAIQAQAANYDKLRAAQESVGKTTQWVSDLQGKVTLGKLDVNQWKSNLQEAKEEVGRLEKDLKARFGKAIPDLSHYDFSEFKGGAGGGLSKSTRDDVAALKEYEAAKNRVAQASQNLRSYTKAESDARIGLSAVTAKDKAAHDALNATMTKHRDLTQTVAAAQNGYGSALAGVAVKATALVAVIGALAAGAAAVGAFRHALSEGAELESLETRLSSMIGNTRAARGEMEKLVDIHLHSPFDLADLEKAAQRLYSVGEGTNDLSRDLKMLGDVAAGTGQKTVGALTEAYARVRADGQLTADSYSQLRSQGLDLTEPLRRLTGRSGEAMRSALTAGVVNFNQFRQMLIAATSEGGQFYQALERENQTFNGQTRQIGREVNALFGEFGQGAATALSGPLGDFNAWLDGLRPKARAVGEEFGHWLEKMDALRQGGGLGAFAAEGAGRAVGSGFAAAIKFTGDLLAAIDLGGQAWAEKIGVSAWNAMDKAGLNLLRWFESGTAYLTAAIQVATDKISSILSHVPGSGVTANPDAKNFSEYLQIGKAQADKDYNDLFGKTQIKITGGEDLTSALKKLADDINNSPFGKGFNSAMGAAFSPLGSAGGNSSSNAIAGFGGNSPAAAGTTFGLAAGTALNGTIHGRGKVFGLNMDGSTDMTDVGRWKNHPEWAHQGAYRETDLTDPSLVGAAISPSQASILTGIADTQKAMAAILGKWITVADDRTGKTTQVQVVDRGPASQQGVELTPAAHRLLGSRGSDPLSASYNGMAVGSATRLPELTGEVRKKSTDPIPPAFGDQKVFQEAEAEISRIRTLMKGANLDADEGARRIADIGARAAGSIYDPKRFSQFLGSYRSAMLERERIAKAVQDRIARGESNPAEAALAGVRKATAAYENLDQQISNIAEQGTGSFADGLSGALVGAATNGKAAFADFFKSFAAEIEKAILKALILKTINMAISSFGGGGTAVGAQSSNAMDGLFTGMHDGGVVGRDSTFTRPVDMSVFSGAPRYHSGGLIGLQPGERPIIAQDGEMMLSREDVSNLNRGGARADGGSVTSNNQVTVHVHPNGNASASGTGGKDDETFYRQVGTVVQRMVDSRITSRLTDEKRSGGQLNPRGNGR